MKILFISDIHGIAKNLEILNFYSFDTLVLLGDLFHDYYEDNDYRSNQMVKSFINKNRDKVICVKGNCDTEYTYITLGLPANEFIKFADEGITFYCSHGHKKVPAIENKHLYIYGHEHVPYIKRLDNSVHICVGSISKPRGGTKASFGYYANGIFTLYSIEGQVIDQLELKKTFL